MLNDCMCTVDSHLLIHSNSCTKPNRNEEEPVEVVPTKDVYYLGRSYRPSVFGTNSIFKKEIVLNKKHCLHWSYYQKTYEKFGLNASLISISNPHCHCSIGQELYTYIIIFYCLFSCML